MHLVPRWQKLAKIKKWRFRNLWLTLPIVSACLIIMTLTGETWMPDFPISYPLYIVGAILVAIGCLGFLRFQKQTPEIRASIFSFNKLVDELLSLNKHLARKKGILLEMEIPDNFICRHDPVIIRIILRNLLINANKFTSEGRISLKAYKANTDIILILTAYESIDTPAKKNWGPDSRLITETVRLVNGKMHIVSKRPNETTVIITLPPLA